MNTACAECHRPISEHDRHIRFTLPDPVLTSGVDVESDEVWMSHETPAQSVMMQANDLGAFVRVLVPVKLTGGYTVTFGAWAGVSPADMRKAFDDWWAPAYVDLVLDGRLANELLPWQVFGAPIRVTVRNADEAPYCTSSSDAEMAGVLNDVWPHESVLGGLSA